MKFGVAYANAGPFAEPELLQSLAHGAEQTGFESFWTIEHVVVPVGYTAEYPYSRSGKLPGSENLAILDPIVPLAFLAATTKTLRLGTGMGWLHEEFDVLGIPFKERAPRTEESMRAIRSLWKAKPEPFEGRFFDWDAVESNPSPCSRMGYPSSSEATPTVPLAAPRAAWMDGRSRGEV